MTQITNIFALEELNVNHKKLIQRLTGFHGYFESGEGEDVEGFEGKMKDIYIDWLEKI